MPTKFDTSSPDPGSISVLDLLLPDLNGIVRGKRVQGQAIVKTLRDGLLLPQSVFASDVCGDTAEATTLGIVTGDKDFLCRAEADTLRSIPWAENTAAQCMMEMHLDDGSPYSASPRHLLRTIVGRLNALGFNPTVAVELEFYLFRNTLDETGLPQLLIDPVTGRSQASTQVYSIDDLDENRAFIRRVRSYCDAQQVPASAAIAEYAPGQFEINLMHKPDALAACDDALLLKRIIKKAAADEDMLASFMAKPMAGLSGSGMHVHVSLQDDAGNNVLQTGNEQLLASVAGLQATMNDSMLLFAPHANSYRRFQKKAYVPLSPSWGYNNRTVAIRIPAGPASATRIEQRLAGADANAYLVVAAILAGMLTGLERRLSPDEPIEGDAAEQRPATLSRDWYQSIERFAASPWIEDVFGSAFQELYTTIKRAEYNNFQASVPPLDASWYLRTV